MSIASWHKKSSYDTFFHCIIGGLFFLLSVFTGLVHEIMPPVFCYALLSYKLRNIQALVYAPVGGRYIFPEVNEYRVCFSFKFIALHTVDFA